MMLHMVLHVGVASFSGEQKSEGTRFCITSLFEPALSVIEVVFDSMKQACFMQREVCYEAACVNALCELLKEHG